LPWSAKGCLAYLEGVVAEVEEGDEELVEALVSQLP
jgi:hypothetical protein